MLLTLTTAATTARSLFDGEVQLSEARALVEVRVSLHHHHQVARRQAALLLGARGQHHRRRAAQRAAPRGVRWRCGCAPQQRYTVGVGGGRVGVGSGSGGGGRLGAHWERRLAGAARFAGLRGALAGGVRLAGLRLAPVALLRLALVLPLVLLLAEAPRAQGQPSWGRRVARDGHIYHPSQPPTPVQRRPYTRMLHRQTGYQYSRPIIRQPMSGRSDI